LRVKPPNWCIHPSLDGCERLAAQAKSNATASETIVNRLLDSFRGFGAAERGPMTGSAGYWIPDQVRDDGGGNIARAAAALEISPSTIYRKKLGWERAGAA